MVFLPEWHTADGASPVEPAKKPVEITVLYSAVVRPVVLMEDGQLNAGSKTNLLKRGWGLFLEDPVDPDRLRSMVDTAKTEGVVRTVARRM